MTQCSLKNYFIKSIIIFLFIFILSPFTTKAQAVYQPYSYQFYQKLNSIQYSTETRQHTALKPFLIDSVMRPSYDSLMNLNFQERDSWLGRKIYNEHLIESNQNNSHFYADILPDLSLGRDFAGGGKNTFVRTLGAQIGGNINDKFYYYISAYNNRSIFPNYINTFIDKSKVVPGQTYGDVGENVQDWNNYTAVTSYTPSKYLNISLAYDKNFIGDGYRSMLLSDVASNYTSLKLTGKLGNVQYMTMWSYMIDPLSPELVDKTRGKWGTFQYLDWNVNNRLSLGFFQSIIWANRTESGNGVRGIEPAYLNPIIFLRSVESSDPDSPDKMHLGLNAKYKILNNFALYGQFLLGEFTAKEFFTGNGYLHNKWGAQLGFRTFDTFGLKSLNLLGEFNAARPYTYTHFDPISNYSHFSQPLAHPLGANFREFVGIANYSIKRFDFSLQGNYSSYGLDPDDDSNFGKNIFKSYFNYESLYGNYIGQGLKTNLTFIDTRVSYLLNSKYNLRFELGAIIRQEKNERGKESSKMVTLGLRSSFRNLYYDF
ncbi:gliding motility protein RemB [Albibacterium bauzanense]|nr:gliding motility protein RemB [Albibacterium bauzanense]